MDLEQQLRAALAPCEPGPESESVVMARISAVARRKPNRVILFGTILAVAAAAAMLVTGLWGASAPPAMVAAPTSVTAPEVDAVPSQAPATALQPAEEIPAQKEATASIKPFTVRMLPLHNNATDAASKAAVDLFYASLLDGLRAVPGLTLIDSGQTGSAGNVPADYRLTILGRGPTTGNKFGVTVAENVMEFPGGVSGATGSMSWTGDIAPACTGSTVAGTDQAACADPVSLAASVLDSLRRNMFPPDPSRQRHLQTRLLDSVQDPQQRARFLADLASSGQVSRTLGNKMLESGAVNAAIELAETTTDPALRAGIWQAMRGLRNAELLQPLVASLREDQDGEVRLQAVTTLVVEFAENPRVREALEVAAREDRRPLVRALAQRVFSGNTDWKKYVVASLKDTSRSEAERIEALVHHLCQPGSTPSTCTFRVGPDFSLPSIKDQLDDEAIQALAQVLPKTGPGPAMMVVTSSLVGQLGSIDRPAATGLLLDILDQTTDRSVRTNIVKQLSRRTGDPRVRAALERISTGDEDLQLRELASNALQEAPLQTAQ